MVRRLRRGNALHGREASPASLLRYLCTAITLVTLSADPGRSCDSARLRLRSAVFVAPAPAVAPRIVCYYYYVPYNRCARGHQRE